MKKWILFLLVFGIWNVATAQEYLLNGKVRDSKNNPLSKVIVMIKNTNKGTWNDFDGNFQIKVEPKDTLVFFNAKSLTKEVFVNGQKEISVILQENPQASEKDVPIIYFCGLEDDESVRPITKAHEYWLKGKVLDTNNIPLSEVRIAVENTPKNTQTNSEGKFKIKVKFDDILVLTCIGMKPQKRSVKGSNDITIVLKADNLSHKSK